MKLAYVLTSFSVALASTYPRVYYANTSTTKQSTTSYRELTSLVLSSTQSDGSVSTFFSEAFVSLTTLTTNDIVTVVTTWCPLGTETANTRWNSYSQKSHISSIATVSSTTAPSGSVATGSAGKTETVQRSQGHTKEVTICPTCSVHSGSTSSLALSTATALSPAASSSSYPANIASQGSLSSSILTTASSARMSSVSSFKGTETSIIDSETLSSSSIASTSHPPRSSSIGSRSYTPQGTLTSASDFSENSGLLVSSSFNLRPRLTTETVNGRTTVFTTWCPLTSDSNNLLSSVITSSDALNSNSGDDVSSDSQMSSTSKDVSESSTHTSSSQKDGYTSNSMVTITSTSFRTVVYSTEVCVSRRCYSSLTSIVESTVYTTSVRPTGAVSSSDTSVNTARTSKTKNTLKSQVCSLSSCQETTSPKMTGTSSKPISFSHVSTSETGASSNTIYLSQLSTSGVTQSLKSSSEGHQFPASSTASKALQSCVSCANNHNYNTAESKIHSSAKASSASSKSSTESSQKSSQSKVSSSSGFSGSVGFSSTYSIVTTTSNGVVTIYTTWCPLSSLKASSAEEHASSSLASKDVTANHFKVEKSSVTQRHHTISERISSFMTVGSGASTLFISSVTSLKPFSRSTPSSPSPSPSSFSSSRKPTSVPISDVVQESGSSASYFTSSAGFGSSLSDSIGTVTVSSSTALASSSTISTEHSSSASYSSSSEAPNSKTHKTSSSSLISTSPSSSSSRYTSAVPVTISNSEETSCTQCQRSGPTSLSTELLPISSVSSSSQSQALGSSSHASTPLRSSVTYTSKIITTTNSGIRRVYTTYCPWTSSAPQETPQSEKQRSSAVASSAVASSAVASSAVASSAVASSATWQLESSSGASISSKLREHQTTPLLKSETPLTLKSSTQPVNSKPSSSEFWTSKVVTTTEGGATTIYTTWCPLEDLRSSGSVVLSSPSKNLDSTFASSTSSSSRLDSVPTSNEVQTKSKASQSSESSKSFTDSSAQKATSYETSSSLMASKTGISGSVSSIHSIPVSNNTPIMSVPQSAQDTSKMSFESSTSSGKFSASSKERTSVATQSMTESPIISSRAFSSSKTSTFTPRSSATIISKATTYSSSLTVSITTVLPFTKTSTGENGQLITVVTSQSSTIPTVTAVLVKTRVPVTTYIKQSTTETSSHQATKKTSTKDTTSSWVTASTISTYEGSAPSSKNLDGIFKVAAALLLTFIM
ncbi:LAQU0S09e04016g1_1 [Lachancea quebecensis]|uniref:LAQU0S09e04016g1_1 n=1 Tax=Lachancea quebecensis TaxID=1654605 RepID=A0A0P1KTM9_9SACH|nr:LAQU0S09e04016g1_1 [Lachancea quebecensis]